MLKRHTFKKYCDLYSEFFETDKPVYTTINYDDLMEKIIHNFSYMDSKQKMHKEILLKKNISEYQISSFSVTPYVTAFIAFMAALFADKLKAVSDPTTFLKQTMIYFLSMICSFLFIEEIFDYKKTVSFGFYSMCLDLLNKVNNSNSEK